MRTKHSIKSMISGLLAMVIILGTLPGMSVFAAQSNEYTDPADVWMEANGRTNELDMNATTTYETQYCTVCNRDTLTLTYRVPEYTKTGETALNRGVKHSDGTCIDGVSKGNLDDGTPGADAFYSGYHWTKSVCQVCGTFNAVNGEDSYDFNRNVYTLYSCDNNFYLDFDNTTYEPYDENYHMTTLKKGQYCQFCKGTYARASEKKEAHHFTDTVDAQIGNNRFYVTHTCDDCGYETSEYVTAKSVVGSYYGLVDGEAHTLDISDLSESGVKTSIKYGNDAEHCTLNSAPNYTNAGYNKVYYKITYSYAGESMTENGVSYVWLLDDAKDEEKTLIIIPPSFGKEEQHIHDFRYIDTVKPSCTNLGYEMWQCMGEDACGQLEKRNYTPATGHTYKTTTIREATCTQGGLKLHICENCGDFYEETTPTAGHHYHTKVVNPTCKAVGYTEHTCENCGDTYITDITPMISHSFERITKKPTCTDRGYTTSTCTNCGYNYVSDYTEPVGHSWDDGHTVTSSTCDAEGVIEYNCKNCDEKMIKATNAKGHTHGTPATCTEPEVCEDCGTILAMPKGHTYESKVIPATCKAMGYTINKCKDCGDEYISDYTNQKKHHYHKDVTAPTCTASGYTTYTCIACGDTYVSDYTDKLPHNFEAKVTAPTCTSMGYTTYTCKDCGESYVSDYTDVLPHNYNKETVEPTCTEHGYAIYTCPDCGKSYIGDYTDEKEHHYTETVVPPTCTEMGYSIFKCDDCGDEYKGNYTDKAPHDYEAVVTNPTCTAMGYTTYTCKNCKDSYVSDYTDKIAHNYKTVVTAPTCTEFGFTTYTCSDCGDSFVADHTDKIPHDFVKVVTEPTCTDFGYTTYTCSECGHSYISDHTDKVAHTYVANVTEPTCTKMGFMTYTCSECGNSYVADYKEQKGHTPSEWIIDEPATIENAGEKHIECTECHEVLSRSEIAQLIDTDRSDEDGKSEVGAYSIILTDKNGVPVFDSEITIDVDDNITIKLPDGRLLDYADQTTVTVFNTETQAPVSDLRIFMFDGNNNAATGITDENGQLKVPNSQSSTGDDNGTIGTDTDEAQETYVVKVTDKNNAVIPNCNIHIGESNNIVVELPAGVKPSKESPVIVTVTDHNGNPKSDITIIAIGEADYIEKGKTDIYGKITLPVTNEGYTDENGKVNVDNLNVIVNNETGLIPNAYVIHNEDGSINVELPEGILIDYSNRITVTVLDSMGNAVANILVNVKDKAEKEYSANTGENGRIIVPPTNEDMSDKDGNAVVNGHNVNVADETGKPIENAFITIDETGKIKVELPEEIKIDIANRIIVTVTDKDGNPEKDIKVDVEDKDGKAESNLTDENGKATVPPTNIDYTDVNGYGELDGYAITVKNADGAIEKAYLELDRESGKITVTLPEGVKIDDYNNRVTVNVVNKADNTPAKDIDVTIKETVSDGEPKTATGKTDSNGNCTVPPVSEDITDEEGKSDVTEEKTVDGKDTDGDGKKDTPDETVTTSYIVIVKDTKELITTAFVKIVDGKVYVTLPDGKTLTTSNQTTVTVLDKDSKPVKGVSVTVTDNNKGTATKDTDANGQITVPVKSSSGGGGGSSRSSGGGGGSISTNTTNVTVTDKDGKNVSVTKSVDSKGNVTITLPIGKTLENGEWYTITTTDRNGAVKPDVNVVLKDKNKNEANGTTDKNGSLVLPGKEHKAYIVGYEDGTFRPNSDMSRAEAATIFARLISDEKGEAMNGKSSFKDVSSKEWYANAIGYLEKYDIIKGYSDNTFKPDEAVTRAEFVTMAVRYYDLFNDVKIGGLTAPYTDVAPSYWAYDNIAYAKNIGWLNGYADGTFKGDNNITRAEVVTVVNHATDRKADEKYINANYTKLNRFTDVKDSNEWFFDDVFEAANTHRGVKNADSETWVK